MNRSHLLHLSHDFLATTISDVPIGIGTWRDSAASPSSSSISAAFSGAQGTSMSTCEGRARNGRSTRCVVRTANISGNSAAKANDTRSTSQSGALGKLACRSAAYSAGTRSRLPSDRRTASRRPRGSARRSRPAGRSCAISRTAAISGSTTCSTSNDTAISNALSGNGIRVMSAQAIGRPNSRAAAAASGSSSRPTTRPCGSSRRMFCPTPQPQSTMRRSVRPPATSSSTALMKRRKP